MSCTKSLLVGIVANNIHGTLQAKMLARMSASEEERLERPNVWCGWKGQRPAGVKLAKACNLLLLLLLLNDTREGWTLEDIKEGSYICFQPAPESEYFKQPGFEVAKVARLDEEPTDDTRLFVIFQQFDP